MVLLIILICILIAVNCVLVIGIANNNARLNVIYKSYEDLKIAFSSVSRRLDVCIDKTTVVSSKCDNIFNKVDDINNDLSIVRTNVAEELKVNIDIFAILKRIKFDLDSKPAKTNKSSNKLKTAVKKEIASKDSKPKTNK